MHDQPGEPGIAIVGAGPAGLVLAHLLQRAAIPFVVFERKAHADLCRLPKAGLIEYRTVRLLEREGIAGPILRFTAENHRCEFRTPGETVLLDYAALTGGRPHYIYPQHQLVQRVCESLIAAGGEIRFSHAVRAVRQDSGGVVLTVDGPGGSRPQEARYAVAVGCEGSRSPVAAAMDQVRVNEQSLPVRWLVILGAAPPLENHTIYAAHPRGFAGQMRRGPSHTRYMLEIPAADTTDGWSEQRIRDELATRLGAGGRLDDVPLSEIGVLDLRMRVTEPMQQGPLFLAGDAAHLITPVGGKGMNLAIQDAVELAHGLIERFGPEQDGTRLAAYSATRLPPIWRTEAFSSWFLHVILTSLRDGREPPAAVPGGFSDGLRQGWIAALQDDPLFARWFAHAYAGVDTP
ncbi:MAG TPA: FAD-dependent monooxygenase [Streptosporangiaceae bacterium]|nr:FAD-dependent monooxygenase [Streptosporangiaceae bacterium]